MSIERKPLTSIFLAAAATGIASVMVNQAPDLMLAAKFALAGGFGAFVYDLALMTRNHQLASQKENKEGLEIPKQEPQNKL